MDCVLGANGLQHRIGPEALPAAPITGLAAEGTNSRSEVDICAFATELFAECYATLVYQVLVPSATSSYAGGKCCNMIGAANTQGRVLKTQLGKSYSRSTSRHSNTDTIRLAHVFRDSSALSTHSMESQSTVQWREWSVMRTTHP